MNSPPQFEGLEIGEICGEYLHWIAKLLGQFLLKLRNVGNPVWVIAPNTMLWSAGHSASLLHLGEWWLHLPRSGGAKGHCIVTVQNFYQKSYTEFGLYCPTLPGNDNNFGQKGQCALRPHAWPIFCKCRNGTEIDNLYCYSTHGSYKWIIMLEKWFHCFSPHINNQHLWQS